MYSFVPFQSPDSTIITIKDNIPKLCLNMIVKNESKVILRLLESVIALIDGYCICDTGSTDNTIEIIETFFKTKGISGKIIREPFRDFGYNRTFALNACKDIQNMDYLLLLDADMVLSGNLESPIEFKKGLKADCYHICQGSLQYYYKNVRIIKNYKDYSYWGVTHEYVNTPPGTIYDEIAIETLFINDIGDGGAKNDKFQRDIRLLTKGLEDNPDNDRYTFYLANSYRDSGDTEKAIETFRKRITLGGWIEEIWHSHYNIGICYKKLGETEKAICAWMEAFQAHPKRIESVYEIVKYYRELGKNKLAYLFYKAADSARNKWGVSNDYLFLQKDVYDYKLDYEMSIIGYYANYDEFDMPRLCMNVLAYPYLSESIKTNIMTNYKYYTPKLIDLVKTPFNQPFLTTATDSLDILGISGDIFVKSTPSICLRGNHLIVNIRYVNYRIDEKGNYINQSSIITRNAIAVLDISKPVWKIIQEFELEYNKKYDDMYVGLEDVRLMVHNNSILYNSNRGIQASMTVEHGEISLVNQSTIESKWPKTIEHNVTEKNWTLLPGDEITVVYHWKPDLILGHFIDDRFVEKQKNPVPPFFKELRGSTNGIVIKDEIWIICHTVSYEDRRYYYHVMVVLDKETFNVKRYTTPFTFEGEKVEYTLGFVYLENTDEILIGYSLYDKCTKYILIGRTNFENMMIEK